MLISFFSIAITEEVEKTNIQELKNHWTFIVKGHSDHYIFGKTEQRLKNIQPNSALIMQQQLEMSLKDPQLVVRTNHQWVSVYIGEKLIYKYAPTTKQKEPGLLQSAIHLPSNYRKEKLRIITKTPYDYYAGIPAQVFIGEAEAVDRFFILHSLPQLLLWITCSTIIILMLIVLFLKRKGPKKESILTLILIGFTFLIGLQSIILNVPASTLFEPKTLSVLYNLTAILIPVFLTSYYLLRTKKYQQYYLYGVGSQLFLLIFGVLCMVAGKLSLPVAVQIFSGFNVFMTLYTAAIALAESADQNQFYTICSPGIIMAAFIHCFFYIQLFAGAANLTTDWPLILFSGLMILISGYHFGEAITFIRHYRIKQQEYTQQLIRLNEKQSNLLTAFKLLAEKEAYMNKEALSLTYFLQQMRDYYQKEFRKQAKFFSCQLIVEQETEHQKDENLYLLIQLFEKFLNDSNFGTIDISMKQENQQLIIESSTSAFTRHSFDESVEATIPVSSHQELEQAVKRSNGDWHWQNKEKKQYFKITLGL
ncbi:MFS transporter [Enterococcus raffinosus]|nr:MFS transporter [Enterococcus raffinosus]